MVKFHFLTSEMINTIAAFAKYENDMGLRDISLKNDIPKSTLLDNAQLLEEKGLIKKFSLCMGTEARFIVAEDITILYNLLKVIANFWNTRDINKLNQNLNKIQNDIKIIKEEIKHESLP